MKNIYESEEFNKNSTIEEFSIVEKQGNRDVIRKRIVYYDILRIIAIFGIILIHTSAENWYGNIDKNFLCNNYINGIVGGSLAMFITISGALMLDNPKFTFKTMVKKYIPRILFCLIIWSCI